MNKPSVCDRSCQLLKYYLLPKLHVSNEGIIEEINFENT